MRRRVCGVSWAPNPERFQLSRCLVAAREHHGGVTLNMHLPWKETHAEVVRGLVFSVGRALAHALAVNVIESDRGLLSERVRRLAAMDGAALLAIEPGYRAWLLAGMPALNSGS